MLDHIASDVPVLFAKEAAVSRACRLDMAGGDCLVDEFRRKTLVARTPTPRMYLGIDARSFDVLVDLPAGFLPERFTLTELENLCAQLLGHRLDKSSFRRRLAERGNVEPVEGETRGGAFRPAQLYRYVPSRLA